MNKIIRQVKLGKFNFSNHVSPIQSQVSTMMNLVVESVC